MSTTQNQPEVASTELTMSMLFLFGGPAIAFVVALFFV